MLLLVSWGFVFPGSGARIMAFVGGPSTEGPGSVSQFLFLTCSLASFPFSLSTLML